MFYLHGLESEQRQLLMEWIRKSMTDRAIVLIANNLEDLYLEDGQLMPIFKERQRQEEPCVR